MSDHASAEQLSALIDGELSLTAREAVIGHLRECPTCAASHERLIEVAAVMTSYPAEHWTRQMTERVLLALERGEPEPPQLVMTRDWSPPIALLLAVAGLLAVVAVAPFFVATALDGLHLNLFAALAAGAGLPVTGFLVVLLLLPALGLFAVPLIRHR